MKKEQEKIKKLELEEMELPEDKVILTFVCTLESGKTLQRGIKNGYDMHLINNFVRSIDKEAENADIVHFYDTEQYNNMLGVVLEDVKGRFFTPEELTEGGILCLIS